MILKERSQLFETSLVVSVDMINQLTRQNCSFNQLTAVGSHSHIFPSEEIWDFGMLDARDYILDSDTELSVLVETGLV